jgi:hypothetical protein
MMMTNILIKTILTERRRNNTGMAVVKANYVKKVKTEKNRAKATVRYIQHRPGKDNEKTTRTLFGRHGVMERTDAYQMIDNAKKSDILFRFVINPDPSIEDQQKDLNMRQITESVMLKIEEITGKTVLWTAALHADHTDKRHIHALAIVPGRLYAAHFNTLIHEATRTCRQQRQELDLVRAKKEREREQREEEQWERGH